MVMEWWWDGDGMVMGWWRSDMGESNFKSKLS